MVAKMVVSSYSRPTWCLMVVRNYSDRLRYYCNHHPCKLVDISPLSRVKQPNLQTRSYHEPPQVGTSRRKIDGLKTILSNSFF